MNLRAFVMAVEPLREGKKLSYRVVLVADLEPRELPELMAGVDEEGFLEFKG